MDPIPVNPADRERPSSPENRAAPPPPDTLGGWFRRHWWDLALTFAALAFILRYLHPLDLLLAGGGLSLIIFLHELGHFAAAKLCDVHVTTFSIGFGPALPFCQFRYGETTYKLAMIPLGGYVAMVGEGDEEGDVVEGEPDPEAAARDPRNFMNKPVIQRMFVISAGVVMNVIFGFVCFLAAYLHGVQEQPAVAAYVESGSAAWRAGIRSGTEITRLNGRQNPWFDDVRPLISSTSAGETVSMDIEYAGKTATLPAVEPLRPEGASYPQLGIIPPEKAALFYSRRDGAPPFVPGSAAADFRGPIGERFEPGDEIVGMTDPANPERVTPLDPKPGGLPGASFDLQRRLLQLAALPGAADRPITIQVRRRGAPADAPPVPLTGPLGARRDVGLRMRMGEVTAVRVDSPAAGADVRTPRVQEEEVLAKGDRITRVELPEPDGSRRRFVANTDEPGEPLDPLRLPFELELWSDRQAAAAKPDFQVAVTVLRDVDHTPRPVELSMEYDRSFRYDLSRAMLPGSPVPLNGLGLAYQVLSVVDGVRPGSPAAEAGLRKGDTIARVRFASLASPGKGPGFFGRLFGAAEPAGSEVEGAWDDVEPGQWAYADFKLQVQPPHKFAATVQRGGADGAPPEELEVALLAAPDRTWPQAELGLAYARELRVQKAADVAEALQMGGRRTLRKIQDIYLGLYGLAFGRISTKVISGPITLARASYIIAGEDVWHLLLWMGLISMNLAVVNFLPIPVLDGGHMVFLIYEWLRGKAPPPAVGRVLTYIGLAAVLTLMAYALKGDIGRILF